MTERTPDIICDADVPPQRNRKEAICFSPDLYRARSLVARLFNKIKQYLRVAFRYDKLAANDLAFIKPYTSAFGCACIGSRPSVRPVLQLRLT